MTGGSSRPRHLLQIALLALGYWAAARIGLNTGSLPGNLAPVWPSAGIALAAVFVWGPAVAPGVFLGEFLANNHGLPTMTVTFMALGNVVEALLGAHLLKHAKVTRALQRPRDVGALVLLAAGLSTIAAATIGNSALVAGHAFPASTFWMHWRTWWAGDALGMLIVTPLLLTWTDREAPPFNGNLYETAGVILAMGVSVSVALEGANPSAYLLYPVVAWAALRFGGRGASMTTSIVAALAVFHTVNHGGPFAGAHPISDLFLLDAFLAVLACMGMLLASVVASATGPSAN